MHINYLSLGAGVQSSTMALMFSKGPVAGHPAPDCAIFADTGAEPVAVYEWLDYLETQLTFPLYRVMEAKGLEENIKLGIQMKRFASVPFFTETDKGRKGMLRRQCTKDFKIVPIERKVRELLGMKKGQRRKDQTATGYIGISWDEVQRMKPSQNPWIDHIWPLIDLRMTRTQCIAWLTENGYKTPPKSACYFCPFHGNREWLWLRENAPEDWEKAVEMDRIIRDGVRGTKEKLFLHETLIPLDEVLLSQEEAGQLSMFDMECYGMCGV